MKEEIKAKRAQIEALVSQLGTLDADVKEAESKYNKEKNEL